MSDQMKMFLEGQVAWLEAEIDLAQQAIEQQKDQLKVRSELLQDYRKRLHAWPFEPVDLFPLAC